MQISSLGLKTEMIFLSYSATVKDRGAFISIKTPSNPAYRWGNYLLFDSPPKSGDFEKWTSLFRRLIGSGKDYSHMLFAWDSPSGELGETKEFIQHGFKLETEIVQSTRQLTKPSAAKIPITIRALDFSKEYKQVIETHFLCRGDEEADSYRKFWEQNALAFQEMIDDGAGLWFGAFVDGKLVSDMGIFFKDGVARYQAVVTLKEYRNNGIASNLVYFAGQYAFRVFRVSELLIAADNNYYAKDIYHKLGFRKLEQNQSLERH